MVQFKVPMPKLISCFLLPLHLLSSSLAPSGPKGGVSHSWLINLLNIWTKQPNKPPQSFVKLVLYIAKGTTLTSNMPADDMLHTACSVYLGITPHDPILPTDLCDHMTRWLTRTWILVHSKIPAFFNPKGLGATCKHFILKASVLCFPTCRLTMSLLFLVIQLSIHWAWRN